MSALRASAGVAYTFHRSGLRTYGFNSPPQI